VTINALAILDEYDWLEEYYVESVIGGPSAFVRTAESRESFAEAILYKLVDEIAGVQQEPSRVLRLAMAGPTREPNMAHVHLNADQRLDNAPAERKY